MPFLELLTAIAVSVPARHADRVDMPLRAQTGRRGSLPQLRALPTVFAIGVLVPGCHDTSILVDAPVLLALSRHLQLLVASHQPRTGRQRARVQGQLVALGTLGSRILYDDGEFRRRFQGTKGNVHIFPGGVWRARLSLSLVPSRGLGG